MSRLWSSSVTAGVLCARFANGAMNYFTDAAVIELGELVAQWRDHSIRAIVPSCFEEARRLRSRSP